MNQLKHDIEVWNTWIKEYKLNISINPDFSLNYNDGMWISNKNISRILLHFYKAYSTFCYHNSLTTLEGAPKYVKMVFYCDNNSLKTLDGAPIYVGGRFDCRNNSLTTLEGAPKYVSGSFSCENNPDLNPIEVEKYLKSIGQTV